MTTSWVVRFKYLMAKTATKPGIWRLKSGGYYVRAQFGQRALPEASLAEAVDVRAKLSQAPVKTPTTPLFSVFAVSLFEERILTGKINSPATRERWDGALKHYILPFFKGKTVTDITHPDVVAFVVDVGRWIKHGKPSLKDPKVTVGVQASTVNGWLRILRTILAKMTVRYDLPRDPFKGIEFFREERVYTSEEPNSLSPDQVREWLRLAREIYPQHFAMMVLGFVTGRRPGELRALRRNIDVLWMRNEVLIRRSHSRGQEVNDRTKTDNDLVLSLPQEVMDILKDHVKALPPGPMRDSNLLFPATTGGIRSRSGLDKPFDRIIREMGIQHNVTPRAMRRSFQDLAREAQIEALVTRSISGHQTEEMRDHYSTVRGHEQRAGLEKVLRLVK